MTKMLINSPYYTRLKNVRAKRLGGETSSGGETTRGGDDQGENVFGTKRLEEEVVLGRNDPETN